MDPIPAYGLETSESEHTPPSFQGIPPRGSVEKKINSLIGEQDFPKETDLENDIKKDISNIFHSFKEWGKSLIPGNNTPKTRENIECGDEYYDVVEFSDEKIGEQNTSEASRATPLETMSRIEYFARKIFEKISQSEDKKLQKYHSEQIALRAHYNDVSTNQDKLDTLYTPSKGNAGKFMSIPDPSSQMVKPEDLKKSFSDKKAVAASAATNKELYENIPSKTIPKIGKLTAYSFESGSMKKGSVTPTSYFLGTKDEQAKNHLMNLYVIQVKGKAVAEIRSGKIDTKEKADELVRLLKKIHEDFSNGKNNFPPMRVVSHQLNSFETESKMIKNQHGWIAYANRELKGKADLVHINTPSNRFFHTTKGVRDKLSAVGLSGAAKFIEKHLLTGERLSKEQNLDSWGTYVKWMSEDVEKDFEAFIEEFTSSDKFTTTTEVESKEYKDYRALNQFREVIGEISEQTVGISNETEKLLIEIAEAKNEITKLERNLEKGSSEVTPQFKELTEKRWKEGIRLYKNAIGVREREIKGKRSQMREVLVKQHEAIKNFQTKINPQSSRLKALLEPLNLMSTVLESQLDIAPSQKSPSRGQELLCMQLLNDKLGVTTAMNCKSGLDRTGFLFAVKLAMKKMNEQPDSANMNLSQVVPQWDDVTLALNKKIVGMKPGEFDAWIKNDEPLEGSNGKIDKQLIVQVIEFRKIVLDNLIQIGLPITKASTGLEGLKWSPGMKENLVPLNFLPSHVEVVVDGKLQQQPLVNYDPKTGEPTGLTLTGRQLLTKFSGLRGS